MHIQRKWQSIFDDHCTNEWMCVIINYLFTYLLTWLLVTLGDLHYFNYNFGFRKIGKQVFCISRSLTDVQINTTYGDNDSDAIVINMSYYFKMKAVYSYPLFGDLLCFHSQIWFLGNFWFWVELKILWFSIDDADDFFILKTNVTNIVNIRNTSENFSSILMSNFHFHFHKQKW